MSDRITTDPDLCGGAPCIRGMRVRVSDVLDLLDAGQTPEEIVEELPYIELADVEACVQYRVENGDTSTAPTFTASPKRFRVWDGMSPCPHCAGLMVLASSGDVEGCPDCDYRRWVRHPERRRFGKDPKRYRQFNPVQAWFLRRAWTLAYRAYNWLEDRRPAGGF